MTAKEIAVLAANVLNPWKGDEPPKAFAATAVDQFVAVPGDRKIVKLPVFQPNAPRKAGTFTFNDVNDFVAFLLDHKNADMSRVFMSAAGLDVVPPSVTATCILDFHEAGGQDRAGWGQFLAVLKLRVDERLAVWLNAISAASGNQGMGQEEFAAFIEQNAQAVVHPAAADIMNIALKLEGTVGAKFTALRDLDRADRTLHYEETTSTGDVVVPRLIVIRVPIFENGPLHEIEVRLGFKIQPSGAALFWLRAPLLRVILREAVAEVRNIIITEAELPVYLGDANLGTMLKPGETAVVVSEAM